LTAVALASTRSATFFASASKSISCILPES
jgi:hypothetical protein